MGRRTRILALGAISAWPAWAAAQTAAPAQPQAPRQAPAPAQAAPTTALARDPIDPQSIAALERMGGFLRTLQEMAIKEEHMTDEVLESGQKIQLHGSAELKVKRPNRLRADLTSDRKARQFFFDGKTFTIFAPRERYYAKVDAPPTIAELADVLIKRYDLELPLADLFYWGTPKSGIADIRAGTNVGPSTVDGVLCDHYAFRQQDVDWQIWIQRGPQPLPRKLVITTTSEPSQPQHTVLMRWDLVPRLDERQFVFAPPKDAMRIELQVFDAARRQGRAPRPR
jgi:hypothetical protein